MLRKVCAFALLALGFSAPISARDFGWTGPNSLGMPRPGEHNLRILSPALLELTMISSRPEAAEALKPWDFVGPEFKLELPPASAFQVLAGDSEIPVLKIGFKQRPLYAPLKRRDLRVIGHLYLELARPVREGQSVQVKNPSGELWPASAGFSATLDPLRFNPAIHVNQIGYQPGFPKTAMVGYYLGSLGEIPIPAEAGFALIDASGKKVHEGRLIRRPDRGFTYTPAPYQQVFQADFTDFNRPGEYRLAVPGLGASYPFRIHEGTLAAFARTYALGIYHQRCGTNNILPFTRHTHEACHTAPAEVPDQTFEKAQEIIADVTAPAKDIERHTAPILKDTGSSLYPFLEEGKIDVSGGHHDAGDYSKYTINSARFIHALVFAADNFPGAGELDNLGLPESGDGKSDLLQEAKWEADFLAKMQDRDGGFYFLVYPKERRYEDDVLPDEGDPQIVWSKNTSATAAAVGAIAEAGSSPLMKKQFPEAADLYLRRARRGWAFLKRAIERHGRDGAYQMLTHYGNEFLHDDELAWAAAALFAATGEKKFERFLIDSFDPTSPATRRWSWWPLFEGYGCAARAYAFAARSGRLPEGAHDKTYLPKVLALIDETARNHVRFAGDTAYGTSFPDPNKANRNAGWYFSSERAFDITVAYQLRPDSAFRRAVLSNLNYEAGCNPVNVSYITGLGWRRQREIVHQYALNDRRVLPPSGLPIGNIRAGFAWLHHYGKELGELTFPPDGARTAPYPYYDRWADTFNTTTEFVIVDQARSLASLAFWMASTPVKEQKWRAAPAKISGLPATAPAGQPITVRLTVDELDPAEARVVWEAAGQEPVFGTEFTFTPRNPGDQWVEAEACWPDGRRAFAAGSFTVTASADTPPNASLSEPLSAGPGTAALYHLDGNASDAAGRNPPLQLEGQTEFARNNLAWMQNRRGAALRFRGLDDYAAVKISLPEGPKTSISIEAMIFINAFKGYNEGTAKILSLAEDWNAFLEFIENIYEGPMLRGGTKFSVPASQLTNHLTPRRWHHLVLTVDQGGYRAAVDGQEIARVPIPELANWGRHPATLEIGHFDGLIDEIAIKISGSNAPPATTTAASSNAPAPPPQPREDPPTGIFLDPPGPAAQKLIRPERQKP